MSTTTHPNDGCMIVVDDPIGCVVPSPGVKIIGRSALTKHLLPREEYERAFAPVSDEQVFLDMRHAMRVARKHETTRAERRREVGTRKMRLNGLRP